MSTEADRLKEESMAIILKLQPVFGPTRCSWDQCRAWAHKIINEAPYCPQHGSRGIEALMGMGPVRRLPPTCSDTRPPAGVK